MFFTTTLYVINWLHLLATVTWIGGMATNIFVLLPSTRKTLEPPVMGKLMGEVMKRFRIVTYICIVVLALTGYYMNSANANYVGILKIDNLWSTITLIKHIVVAVLVILAIYAYEGLARKAAKIAAKGPSPELGRIQKRQIGFAVTGFILGLIILFLTGMMTAISAVS